MVRSWGEITNPKNQKSKWSNVGKRLFVLPTNFIGTGVRKQ